jgi:hypothetical protein
MILKTICVNAGQTSAQDPGSDAMPTLMRLRKASAVAGAGLTIGLTTRHSNGRGKGDKALVERWAHLGSNQGPPACEEGDRRWGVDPGQKSGKSFRPLR